MAAFTRASSAPAAFTRMEQRGELKDLGTLSEEPRPELDSTLRATIEALTQLDADRLESLARGCERMTGRVTTMEATSARESHRILKCLLEQTRRNLQLLRRITERSAEEYSRPACSQL
ncbi:MAG TPA: hypothetical protein VM554_04275 [Acidisarcina sp.]|nr:hypothetical protein [Acidisarcina sp.]